MSDLRVVRAALACKLMGWCVCRNRWDLPCWSWRSEATGRWEELPVSEWRPDSNPEHAVQVLEAMGASGWEMELRYDHMCYFGQWINADTGLRSPMLHVPDFCRWVAVSAGLALGMEGGRRGRRCAC